MLTSLQVRNFAIIDQVDVVFASGMTVLTGETGAGKSILVDALALVLGERGSAGLVRDGADRAEICAEFDISEHKAARAWLAEQALDMDDACVLRRVIGADGRSRAFINGTTATLQSLAALGALLLDIHGQHFHQSLGRREVQRDLLDHFGKLTEQRNAIAAAWTEWHELATELKSLEEDDADRASRIDLLEFQLDELEVLDLKTDELNDLHAERKKLQYSGRIADGVAEVLQLIYEAEPDNAHRLLAKAQQSLQPLGEFDKNLASAVTLLSESVIQVAEAADQLQRCADDLDADPARRDWIEERLDAVQSIARKHRVEPDALSDLRERVAQQLDDLRNAKQRGEQLEERVASAWDNYETQAKKLSKGRQQAAKKLSVAVTAAMADLGMPGGVFEVTLKPRAANDARAWGLEDAEYLISANPGQRPMPLTKVASGGELSRMSLSI
ncbi:MAG: DNA repair protein RecN, partial [Woeseia sp.]